MSHPNRLSQWEEEVSSAFAHLSRPQWRGLVLWSAGIALSGCAGIVQISALLALVLGEGEQAVFQRLREWYLNAEKKRGPKRRELEVQACFAPLLRWIVRLWSGESQQLALAIDATSLGNRWTILTISVVVRASAIPVAWKVLRAEQEGSWRPYWQDLFECLHEAIPPGWQVLVLADRGLYARWLWELIRGCGWHPFLRLNLGAKARVLGEETFEWLSHWVPRPGTRWQGEVDCFASPSSRVRGTLLMHWEPGYESAWVILTDLAPEHALVSWYGLRTWIEGGFKDWKRGLWGWHHSKMRDASHVERLWLAMALAQLWCVSLGCQAEVQQEEAWQREPPGAGLPATHIAKRRRKRSPGQPPARRLSCVVRGKLHLLAALFLAEACSVGELRAEAWPETMTAPRKQHVRPVVKKKTQKEKERRNKQKRRARVRSRTAA